MLIGIGRRTLCLVMAASAVVSLCVLWLTNWPLGIPGEWVWQRVSPDGDWGINTVCLAVAIGLYVAFVALIEPRFEPSDRRQITAGEAAFWLAGLASVAFAWTWVIQELAPGPNQLSKSAFVLYYPNSSGYFTRARYDAPEPVAFLKGYEALMREGDVLHTGTHPPGLFLVFHGLIAICEQPSQLTAFLDATQPATFREACDVIAGNVARGSVPRTFMPLDRRVLWLATLLVMLSSALSVVPLFELVRRSHGYRIAWLTASFWPAVPAASIFVPKSDVAYGFLGLILVWMWLKAIDHRSLLRACLAGLVAWIGMMMSLAFLPVLAFLVTVTLYECLIQRQDLSQSWAGTLVLDGHPTTRQLMTLVGAFAVGFVVPTLIMGIVYQIWLPVVWILNYRNHAGFYGQFPRNYWKWLLLNPLEIGFATGWPLTLLALGGGLRFLRDESRRMAPIVLGVLSILGVLWMTGKNSGEAARLWILFLPWFVWIGVPWLGEMDDTMKSRRQRIGWIVLALQLTTCGLTVARVNGFPH